MKTQLIFKNDPRYPERLRAIPDAPDFLHVWGDAELLSVPSVAVVGTRTCSAYGNTQAFAFSQALSQQGLCIVSGLAYGIDKMAHEGALKGSGKTIAVVAQSIPELQPVAHRELARKIVDTGGAVVSERSLGEVTYKSDYLVRNRIIAGLSLGTLVVEAPFKSGASNTAKKALAYGRDLWAIPGRIGDPMSVGCHKLIRDGAALVTHPKQITDELEWTWRAGKPQLSGLAKDLYAFLKGKPSSMAVLSSRYGRELKELYKTLAQLELEGHIRLNIHGIYSVASGS